MPSLRRWRHGRGLAGAGGSFHKGFLGWRSALWCSFLLWSLPVLKQWSSQLAASIRSVRSSARLCLGGLWRWLFCSSGIVERWFSWEVWLPRTGSKGVAIFLSARSCCSLSWEQWLILLQVLAPVLLRRYQLQLTSLSSVIVLQPPPLCKGWIGRPLCLSRDSSVLMDLHWPSDCTAKSSIVHRFSISRFSVRHFPERSWIVIAFLRFTDSGQVFQQLVCPLAVVLAQIFFSLTTLFSYPVFFCLFMHFLMLLLTWSHFSDASGSNLFFLSSLLFSQRSRISAVTRIFFFWRCFAKHLTCCFSHCCVEGGDHRIYVCILIIHDGERCKHPAYHSLECF